MFKIVKQYYSIDTSLAFSSFNLRTAYNSFITSLQENIYMELNMADFYIVNRNDLFGIVDWSDDEW